MPNIKFAVEVLMGGSSESCESYTYIYIYISISQYLNLNLNISISTCHDKVEPKLLAEAQHNCCNVISSKVGAKFSLSYCAPAWPASHLTTQSFQSAMTRPSPWRTPGPPNQSSASTSVCTSSAWWEGSLATSLSSSSC